MGTEQRIEVEGKTLSDAIEQACKALEVARRDIEYELNSEHFRGGADTVKIVAWARDSRDVALNTKARDLLLGILRRMGLEGNVEIETGDDKLRAVLVMDEPALVIGRNGETLDALQHLVNKALTRYRGDKRIVVDLEDYREKHETNLKYVAQKICEKVLREGCTVTLKPMNAYDRRLVHLEVAQHATLSSRSSGDGQMKRVQVFRVSSDES